MANDTKKKQKTSDQFYKQYTPEAVAEDMICCLINGDKEGASAALDFLQQSGEGEKEKDKDKKSDKK